MTPEIVRAESAAWFAANWDPALPLGEWWQRLAGSGWAYPSWPEAWFGRGLPGPLAREAIAERRRAGALGPPTGVGAFLAAPTLFAHGTDDQRRRWLPGIVDGSEIWCQLFSEPGAGSDLASLDTRAEPDGEGWAVTGQKVWTSNAQFADWGLLLARTNPDEPRHRGISCFVFDMAQPAVEVRPILEMTGESSFNEVFLDGAHVGPDALLGELHGGWAVAMSTLAHERDPNNAGIESGGGAMTGRPDLTARSADAFAQAGETTSAFSAAVTHASHGLFDRLVAAEADGTDPLLRQQLAAIHTLRELDRFIGLRVDAAVAAGAAPGPEVSVGKLLDVDLNARLSRTGLGVLGPLGSLWHDDACGHRAFVDFTLFAPAMRIASGTDEVQRNIIGEQVLGLPKEPRP